MTESLNIELNNFQSIGEACLTFEPGVNLIVGPSNSGKTAILRAVAAALGNPRRGKYFIKKGTKSAEVTIDFEGKKISWRRTLTDTTYDIDGELFKKTGRNTLFDLDSDTGFVRDDAGNVMNIEGEWDLPFPFDRTPSELFKLFENIFCISDSAVILKAYRDEEAAVIKDKVIKGDKLARFKNKVEALEELAKEVDIEGTESKLQEFDIDCKKYKELSEDLIKIQKSEKYTTIDLDEVTPPIEESLTQYMEAVKDYAFLNKVVRRQKFYKSLPASMIIGDTIDKYEQAEKDYRHVIKAEKLENIDFSKELEPTEETLNKYFEVLKDYEDLCKLKKISKLDLGEDKEFGDSISEYEELLKDYKFIVGCHNKCKDLKGKYLALEERIRVAEGKLSKIKVCPLCGHELGDK